ncbi:MAG TPA: PAS domain-containing sensor histidine kinase [Desulfovibrio sp.]|nr:PAS domain-containing sensor histidine kinase [Desulfovibrio sp.]
MTVLPTLQKNIRRAFGRLMLLFGCLGALLVLAFFIAGRLPTLLVRMNYDSIAYVRQMEEAVFALRLPEQYVQQGHQGREAAFDEALARASANVTEPDEPQAIEAVRNAWDQFRESRDDDSYALLHTALVHLVDVNERGMFRRLDRSNLYRNLTLAGAVVVFLAGTLWAMFLADAVSMRLSHPLRRMAELLKDRPPLGTRLHLPAPQTLEVRILFDEFERQWTRLGELDAVNLNRLLREKRKLEVILESADDAIIVMDNTGCVAHVSRSMTTLLGMPEHELLGQPWHDLSTMDENYLALRGILRDDLVGKGEVELTCNGEPRVFIVRRRSLHDGVRTDGGQVFLLGDVTEKKRRESLRSEMMDWISHELKTPVQSLGLAAELLGRQDMQDDDMRLLVDTIREDAVRLRTVSRQFMDIARMRVDMLRLERRDVDMAQRLGAWLTPFRLLAREKGVGMEVDVRQAPAVVSVDEDRFSWVVSNLVANSLQASPRNTTLTVRLTEASGDLTLTVEDEGPGVPRELEERMFEPYSHGRAAGTKLGLVGLGLAISRTIVEAHGGRLAYERRDGRSHFTVHIPQGTPHGATLATSLQQEGA